MRKIIVYIATSADGYIARPDGNVDWLNRPRFAGDYGMRADTGALAHLLAPDLTYTHTDGAQNSRAELLQLVGSGALRYASIAPEARDVRVVGSSAVVTGRSAMRVEASGQAHAFRIRYLAVYRRGARGWELVAWQSTRLPAE